MRPSTTKTTPWILASLILLLAADAFAARARYVEERAYVGLLGLATSISSDEEDGFTDNWGYIFSGTDYIQLDVLPRIKTSMGFGGLVGYRRGDYALEVSYWRTDHKAEVDRDYLVGIFEGTALYQSINCDLKRFLFTHLPAQPFFNLGLSFPWIVVRNGSMTVDVDGVRQYADLSYSGVGFNLGVGFEFFALPNVTITGGALRRWSSYGTSKGADGLEKRPLNGAGEESSIRDASFNFYVGTTIDFY